MPNIRITEENVLDFSNGTRVLFNYGAMYPTEEGVIVGFEINKWGAHLKVKKDDGSMATVSSFTEKGIGTYLLDEVEPVETKKNPKSPWYKES